MLAELVRLAEAEKRGASAGRAIAEFNRLQESLNETLPAVQAANDEDARRSALYLEIGAISALFATTIAILLLAWRAGRARTRETRAAVALGERLTVANERLRALDGMKDEFVALVSHELRTPLTSIRGYLDLVLDGDAGEIPEEAQEFLAVVARNADRLHRLVGDLLFVAQVDAGRLVVERGDVDLVDVARSSVEAAFPTAEEQSVALVLDTPDELKIEGDASRLAQLMDNIVSNGIKFTPPGGRVTVRLRTLDEEAVLEVADTGLGIPQAEQENLFERFFRASTATQNATQGTGLGLTIAKAIVEAHAGRIGFESADGVGTTFRVELPVCQRAPVV